jgi:hypothetical protein
MSRSNITEVTADEAIVRYTDRFFKRVSAETPAIPAAFDGKYALVVIVATDIAPSEAQMDTLENNIEAINGVYKAFALIGPARIPVDRQPADTELFIRVEAGFDIRPEVVAP